MTTASQTTGVPAELRDLVVVAQREKRAQRFAEAAEAYRRILALRPDIAEAYNDLGNVLAIMGKIDEAAAHYEQAVALKPDLVQAHNNLGNVLREQGKLDLAAARYEQALVLRPDLADAHNNLGNILRAQGKLDEALARYERALALRPDLAELYYNVARILQSQGKLDEAVKMYQRASELRPDLADIHNNLGNAWKQLGEFQQALASYERALTVAPDCIAAHLQRADLKTFRVGDPDLAALEALAADMPRLSREKRLYLHFALGKALEDVGDYRRAFEHLLQANALRQSEVQYDEAACHGTLRLIADRFEAKLFDRLAGVGDPSPAPIFIVGMVRSGSTLIEQILASHPQVQAAGELSNLDRIVKSVSEPCGQPIPFPIWVGGIDSESARRLGGAYLASLPALADDKTRITDKMPMNFGYIGLIRLILPNARIIHTMRDPVDTCVSCFSKLFSDGHAYSYDLAELGRYYARYHELMAHWRSVLPPGAMLDVSYEEVVDNLEEQARRLIDYCGLPWDDHCLSFYKHSRPIATASNVQVRRPLYRSSVARWRRYEGYLQPLLCELENCR